MSSNEVRLADFILCNLFVVLPVYCFWGFQFCFSRWSCYFLSTEVDCILVVGTCTYILRTFPSFFFSLTKNSLRHQKGVTLTKIVFSLFMQIRELSRSHQSISKFTDETILTIQDALMVCSRNSVNALSFLPCWLSPYLVYMLHLLYCILFLLSMTIISKMFFPCYIFLLCFHYTFFQLTVNSVRRIVLDVKVGPPFYEKELAKDVLSAVS